MSKVSLSRWSWVNLSIFLCGWEGAEREAVRRRIECVGEAEGDGGVVGLCGGCGLVGDMAGAVVGREWPTDKRKKTRWRFVNSAAAQITGNRLFQLVPGHPHKKVVCSITYASNSVMTASSPSRP